MMENVISISLTVFQDMTRHLHSTALFYLTPLDLLKMQYLINKKHVFLPHISVMSLFLITNPNLSHLQVPADREKHYMYNLWPWGAIF